MSLEYTPLAHDSNQTAFYNEMADLSSYLKSIVNKHEAKIAAYEESSLLGKVLFTIRNLFANDKSYGHAKELDRQLSLIQAMQDNTRQYAGERSTQSLINYESDVVHHFFTNDKQFNTNGLARLDTDFQDAISKSRSLFDSSFSDRLKNYSATINDFGQQYNEQKQAYKGRNPVFTGIFAWLQGFLNISNVASTAHVSSQMDAQPTIVKSPAMTRTETTEAQSEYKTKKMPVTTDTVADKEIQEKSETKNLTLEQEIEVLRTTNEEQQQERDQLVKQAAINQQNSADNAHEIRKQLQAIQKTELELDQVAKDVDKNTTAIDDVRQSYGKGMKALDQFDDHVNKIGQKLEQMGETEKSIVSDLEVIKNTKSEIEQSTKRIAESNARVEAARKKYEQRKNKKLLKKRDLKEINMNDVNAQIAAISETSKAFNSMRRQ